ncbi:hypothetical protein CAC42_332 [Sphaceloma murrayae]|uniref:3-hydroxyacyl-CoA dehydrogenase n=1 Tax=Sphaceloma murrayae TaxID=2082308 RepID=A0A2K1QZY0_9PEZI|nr:hypothetical protein CAC42_332 [Sphaceloma murrayae]
MGTDTITKAVTPSERGPNDDTSSTSAIVPEVSANAALTPKEVDSSHTRAAFDEVVKVQPENKNRIAIIGCGTIGASLVAMHLIRNVDCMVVVFDPRVDIQSYLEAKLEEDFALAGFRPDKDVASRIEYATSLQEAVRHAEIVQEQGPENIQWKANIWSGIEQSAPDTALLWTSTSGIPATVQSQKMSDKGRLIVCHPYNPPLLMPLIEIVPNPSTPTWVVTKTMHYWRLVKKRPILINSEVTGFVANRLAFAMFREAVSLVRQGVITASDLDELVESSMGPRWAVAGPFKSYHAGGGPGGLSAFMKNIGGTMRDCWAESDRHAVAVDDESWVDPISEECKTSFRPDDYEKRKGKLKAVLEDAAV